VSKSIIQLIPAEESYVVFGRLSQEALTMFKKGVLMWALVEGSNTQGVQAKQERFVEGIILHPSRGPIQASDWPEATSLGYSYDGTNDDIDGFEEIARAHFKLGPSKAPEPETELTPPVVSDEKPPPAPL